MNDGDLELGKVIGLLRRQLRLIIITVIVGVGATVLVVFALTPVYEATALVMVDPSRNLLDPSGDFNTGANDGSRVASELEIMRSDATLLGVIEKEALLSDTEFGVRLGLLDRV